MTFIRLAVALLTMVLAAGAAAKTLDTIEYNGRVEFEFDSGALQVSTELDVQASSISAQKLELLIAAGVEVSQVTGKHVRGFKAEPSEMNPAWQSLTLSFNEFQESSTTIEMSYQGRLDHAEQTGNFITPNAVHLSIDSAWFPLLADFSTPLRGHLAFKLPDDWQLFGPGQVSRNEGWHELEVTDEYLDVAIYAERQPTLFQQGHFTVVADTANKVKAEQIANAGEQCLTVLNQRFGDSRPLPRAKAILSERAGPNFARSSYISLSPDDLGSTTQIYSYLCHELAHHWTAFGAVMSHDYWMVESFAEWVAADTIKTLLGADALAKTFADWQTRAEGQPYVWRDNEPQRASHRVNYGLGPLALQRLKERVGAQAFESILTWYMSENVIETEQLLVRVEAETDVQTRQWFQKVLAGNPTSNVTQ